MDSLHQFEAEKRTVRTALLRGIYSLTAVMVLLGLSGCTTKGGNGGGNGGGGGGSPDFVSMSGNWLISGTSTATPITMSGVIAEQATGSSRFTTAVLQVQSTCYTNAQIVPIDGQVTSTRFQGSSFDVVGQFLSLDVLKSTDATQFSGTYSIKGGCGSGQTGSVTGQRYSELTGTYVGTSASGTGVSINVAQDSNGTGGGYFVVSGTAAFTGVSCFTSGQLGIGAGTISGSSAALQFSANDQAGSQINLQGQIDVAAQTFTVSNASVSGGNCSGSLGQLILKKQ